MGKAWVAASVLLSILSLGVALWALDEARLARSPASGGDGAPAEARRRVLEDRVARLEARGRSAGAADPAAAGADLPIPDGAAPPAGAAPGAGAEGAAEGAPKDALADLVRRTVREEMEAARKGEEAAKDPAAGQPRRPPLTQFAAELDLDAGQREEVHRAVLRGQEDTIALLRTPTSSGRIPIDDLVKAFTEKPDRIRASVLDVYGMLATEKVPGTEDTYAQRIQSLKNATTDEFRRSFSPEQFKAYERTGQDPLEIQIPDSPWIQVLQDAWKRRQ